jgi:hypothetical protein
MTNLLDDSNRHLRTLTAEVLRDIARNSSCPHQYRLAAVEALVGRRSPYTAHPDLIGLVAELNDELQGVQFEFPVPIPAGSGPLSASVTTKTMHAEETVGFTGFSGVEMSEEDISFDYGHNLTPSGEQYESEPAD